MMEAKYRNAAERTAHRDKCETALAGKNPEALAPLIEVTKVLRCCQDQMYAAGLNSEHREIVKALAALDAKHESG